MVEVTIVWLLQTIPFLCAYFKERCKGENYCKYDKTLHLGCKGTKKI